MVQKEDPEQLKYFVLSLLILVSSVSITNLYVFGELSSADKQEIRSLLDDTVKQFLERLLDKDKNSSEFTQTISDYPSKITSLQEMG
jgi:hypothetical protein